MKYNLAGIQKIVTGILVVNFLVPVYHIYHRQDFLLAGIAAILSIFIFLTQFYFSSRKPAVAMWFSAVLLFIMSMANFVFLGGSSVYLVYHTMLSIVLMVYFQRNLLVFYGSATAGFLLVSFFFNDFFRVYPETESLSGAFLMSMVSFLATSTIIFVMDRLREQVDFPEVARAAEVKSREYLDASEIQYIYYLKAISDNITGTAEEIRTIAEKNIESIRREKIRLGTILETAEYMEKTFFQTRDFISETRGVVENTLNAAIKGDADITEIMALVNKMIKFVDITKKSIYDLSAATKKVEGVITVIDKIANQTRLLSLNASIEGARYEMRQAGFVTVSREVKELSALTHLSVQEVTSTMRDIHAKTRTVQDVVNREGQEAMEGLDVARMGEQSVRYVVRMMQSIQSEVDDIVDELEKNENLAIQIKGHLLLIESFVNENLERMELLEATSTDMKTQGRNLDKIIHANRVTEEYLRLNDRMYALLARFSMEFEKLVEHEIRRGSIDEARLFDRNFKQVPSENGNRYSASYDEFFQKTIQAILDKFLLSVPELRYFLLMDNEGYIPLVNQSVQENEPEEAERKFVLAEKPGVILQDYATKFAIKSDNLYTLQCLQTSGEPIMDMSVHLNYKDKFWGVVRAGFRYSV